MESQIPRTTSPSPVERLRALARNIGFFWTALTLLILAGLTAYALAAQPTLFAQPRGWLLLALAAAFALCYAFGRRWVVRGDPDDYYRRMQQREGAALPARAVVFCAVVFALGVALSLVDANLRFMLYPVYGTILGLFALPWSLVAAAPTILTIFAEFGWLPQSWSPDQVAALFVNLFVFALYTAFAYLPFIVIAGRVERERVFAELETSHHALAEAHRRLADAAEGERELAVLRERERLAREMHDTLGHALVLANVKLEAALRLRPVDPARSDHEIAATQEVLRIAMGELRASAVCETPLSDVLARRAREAAARAGWELRCAFAPETDHLCEPTREALLRVTAEALANAERHAHARSVSLSLECAGDDLLLCIADDGIGIAAPVLAASPVAAGARSSAAVPDTPPPLASPPGHYGVTGMRERVEAVGGTLSIGPGVDGCGTVVEARMPALPAEWDVAPSRPPTTP
jgi:signal transduction histidine kinase